MSWLASFALTVFHTVYWFVTAAKSICGFRSEPRPLIAHRHKLPSHVAVLLVTPDSIENIEVTEGLMVESVEKAVTWCRAVGISRLTVFDRQGILAKSTLDIRERLRSLLGVPPEDAADSDIEFPLTPPPSDDSDSRPISPDSDYYRHNFSVATIKFTDGEKGQRRAQGSRTAVRHRRSARKESCASPLTLHLVSRQSGKPAISRAVNDIIRKQLKKTSRKGPNGVQLDCRSALFEDTLNELLEGPDGFPPPDLMLVHRISAECADLPMELYGFPPWQIRLTEFHYSRHSETYWAPWKRHIDDAHCALKPLEEIEFRRALDEFAAAEMRLGK